LITGAKPAYVPSFLGAIKDQLQDAVFTLWFNSTVYDDTESTEPDGVVDFGFIDDTKYTGEIAYTPLWNAGGNTFWAVNISGVGAADPVTGQLISSSMTEFSVIIDSGDGQSEFPQAALHGYYSGIPGFVYDEGGYCYDYPCNVSASLPDLVLFIEDKAVVVPRATYGFWQDMNPAAGSPGIVAGVDYCTTHIRPSDIFNGGTSMLGQDIIEGIFLVLDWENQQVGFANSTMLQDDSSFYVPGYEDIHCSYADSTLVNQEISPYITGCTEEEFGGTCTQVEVSYPGCTLLDSSLDWASVQPNEYSNLRCTFYSSVQCDKPLSNDAMNIRYPGISSLSESPKSVYCLSTEIEPQITAGESTRLLETDGVGFDGAGGGQSAQNPWICSIIDAPSSQFQVNLTSIWTGNGPLGTCHFYQDEYCFDLVSPSSGIDMCVSDADGAKLDVDFGTYVGSHMCI